MRVRMRRWTSAICNYLIACVASFHTPVVVLFIPNSTRGNVVGLCGLNAPLTYV